MNAEKGIKCRLGLISAVLAGALTAAVFFVCGRFPGRERLFVLGDLYVQYVQFIRLFLHNLTQGGDLFYSFNFSMGMPTMAAYAFECLSPVNFVFLLINDIDTAAFIVFIIKTMLAAGSFCIYATTELKANKWETVAFSCAYAMCGYNISYFENIHFQDALYVFPIIIMMIMKLIRENKSIGLILSYSYIFLVNFYSGYMLGIMSFVFFCVCVAGERKRYYCIRKYFISVFVSVLISAAVTIPTACYLLSHYSPAAAELSNSMASMLAVIEGLIPGAMRGPIGNKPAVYSSLIAVLLVIILVIAGRRETLKRPFVVLLFFLILCTFSKYFYIAIHGFEAPDGSTYRFSWLYSFVLISLALIERKYAGQRKTRTVLVVGLCTITGMILVHTIESMVLNDQEINTLEMKTAIAFMILYIAVLFWENKSGKRRGLLFISLLAMEIVANAFFCILPDDDNLERSRSYYNHWLEEGRKAEMALNQMQEDHAFFRVYYENAAHNNNSMLFGYHGIGAFSSVEQADLRRLLYHLGYSTSNRVVRDYGSTEFTRMIFAQKYTVHGTNPLFEDNSSFRITENEQVMPVAFMVSEDVFEYRAESPDPFENQNRLASAMTGEDDIQVFRQYPGTVVISEDAVHLGFENDKWVIHSLDKGGSLSFFVEDKENTDNNLYAYVAQEDSANQQMDALVGSNADIGMPLCPSKLSMPHIIPLTADENGTIELKIALRANEVTEASFKDIYFAYLDHNKLNVVYDELSEQIMEDISFDGSVIRGKVNCTVKKDVVFFSVPYDSGWTAYVDGEIAEIRPVLDGAFIAVKVQPGEHQIAIAYKEKWMGLSRVVSLIGVLMLIGMMVSENMYAIKQLLKNSEGE
ncbi:MAG: YfhO family protein [Lachnospiraceae bacterium]|nr:YfhO family protein [Lachnospiraceae bacterium]